MPRFPVVLAALASFLQTVGCSDSPAAPPTLPPTLPPMGAEVPERADKPFVGQGTGGSGGSSAEDAVSMAGDAGTVGDAGHAATAVDAASPTSGTGATAGTGGTGADSGPSRGSAGNDGGAPTHDGFPELTELKAFPTAEGYGRLAEGGRGGRVIEVTNLRDSGPGSLRHAVEATGPRTVVFRTSGVIELESKLLVTGTLGNGYLTIAGQTAPGKGILVRGWTVGMIGGEHVVVRFIRTRIGTATGKTMDGMGMASADNAIFDHCSISWTIDEAFSSRGAKNVTLQRTLISEALNEAGHSKYPAGTQHGYAASIGGDIGSFHHNLLAHCAGRNWSLAGGLEHGTTRYAGRLDIRNNVVYNWKSRTTDGGAHEVNFVNNYYKPGPATEVFVALNAQNDGFEGTQRYYFAGNVMPGVFDESNQEKGRRASGQERSYDPWVDRPFFESYVTTHTAGEAFEDVLADVGCNVPMLDDHDRRILEETRTGTHTYEGSRTGLPGLPDNENDVGGYEEYPVVTRPADWDVDQDGMPGAWEEAHGLDPGDPADGNATTLSSVGYTNLEMYLNELAGDFQ